MRNSKIKRETKETSILLEINLDGTGKSEISTGIGFFNHMLESFSKHSLIDLNLSCKGDLEVDAHHSIEDIGIVLGMGIAKALGTKEGINRFGSFILPMDEVLSMAAVDFGGRSYLSFDAEFKNSNINEFPTECIYDFFYSLTQEARINLHIKLFSGRNDHHKAEAIFKSVAKAIRIALQKDDRNKGQIPSTKGII